MITSILLALQVSLTVTPAITTTVSVVTKLNELKVVVSGGPGTARDHVGLYLVGSNSLLDWKNIDGTQNKKNTAKSGTLVFTTNIVPGVYEARFVPCSAPDPQPCPPPTKVTQFRVGQESMEVQVTGTPVITRESANDPNELTVTMQTAKDAAVTANKDLPLIVNGKQQATRVGPTQSPQPSRIQP